MRLNILLLELFEERVKFLNVPGSDEVQKIKVNFAQVNSAHFNLVRALNFLDNLVHVYLRHPHFSLTPGRVWVLVV